VLLGSVLFLGGGRMFKKKNGLVALGLVAVRYPICRLMLGSTAS